MSVVERDELPPVDMYEADIAAFQADDELKRAADEQAMERVAVAAAKAVRKAEREEKVDERRSLMRERLMPGGDAIFSVPENPEAIWGEGDNVLWAKGEALMVTGPSGVGKTTLVQQVVFARCGVRSAAKEVLSLPVVEDTEGKVLYVAADRPRQIMRSMRRMVHDDDLDKLNERLVVWGGPLPTPVTSDIGVLLELALEAGARTVAFDSLKDLVYNLESPEAAAQYNAARQLLITHGVDVVEIHHNRKPANGATKANKLTDVFGGMWLTAGAGSVVIVWGEAGDEVVEFTHAKQVANKLGPWKLEHNHSKGTTKVRGKVDVLQLLAASPNGVTVRTVAMALCNTAKPTDAEQQRAKRVLRKLVADGSAVKVPGDRGGAGGSAGDLYQLAAGVTVERSAEFDERLTAGPVF
jgi:replicative DNA helicase